MSDVQSLNRLQFDSSISPLRLCRSAAVALLALLIAFALMVLARRASGALGKPLAPGVLLLTGTMIAAAAATIRAGWFRRSDGPSSKRANRTIMLLTLASLLVLGIGLCVPGTSVVGRLSLIALLALEEVGVWVWYLRGAEGAPTVSQGERPLGNLPHVEHRKPLHNRADRSTEDAIPPTEVIQQLTRRIDADGAETLSGWLRMPFASGQRTANVHVAFCPPMCATPELTVEQIDGPSARIKTAQLLPYGARLDLKLGAVAEVPTDVLLRFSARAK